MEKRHIVWQVNIMGREQSFRISPGLKVKEVTASLVVGLQRVTNHQQRDRAAQDFLVFFIFIF